MSNSPVSLEDQRAIYGHMKNHYLGLLQAEPVGIPLNSKGAIVLTYDARQDLLDEGYREEFVDVLARVALRDAVFQHKVQNITPEDFGV